MIYDKRISITADITNKTAITIVVKKRNRSPPRRANRVMFDAVPPSAPSIPSPARCKIIARIKRIESTNCSTGKI